MTGKYRSPNEFPTDSVDDSVRDAPPHGRKSPSQEAETEQAGQDQNGPGCIEEPGKAQADHPHADVQEFPEQFGVRGATGPQGVQSGDQGRKAATYQQHPKTEMDRHRISSRMKSP